MIYRIFRHYGATLALGPNFELDSKLKLFRKPIVSGVDYIYQDELVDCLFCRKDSVCIVILVGENDGLRIPDCQAVFNT